MRIVFYQRSASIGTYSIERVFNDVRASLPAEVSSRTYEVPYKTLPFAVPLNTFASSLNQGDVNHITGDVNYVAMGLDRKKTILTVHDCDNMRHLSGFSKFMVKKLWWELPVSHCKIVTAVSSNTARDLIIMFPKAEEKIRVIHNPISKTFKRTSKLFNQAKPVLLQVGTRRANKNLSRVVEAIRGIPCILDLIGPLDQEQRELLVNAGIHFRNFVGLNEEELFDRYVNADMVLCLSTWEGFCLPIIEAQAVGRPVVVSNVAPMPEVAGEGASFADPYSIEQIREAILRIIDNKTEWDRLVEQGLENVRRFNPKTIARQYLEVYREVCDG